MSGLSGPYCKRGHSGFRLECWTQGSATGRAERLEEDLSQRTAVENRDHHLPGNCPRMRSYHGSSAARQDGRARERRRDLHYKPQGCPVWAWELYTERGAGGPLRASQISCYEHLDGLVCKVSDTDERADIVVSY